MTTSARPRPRRASPTISARPAGRLRRGESPRTRRRTCPLAGVIMTQRDGQGIGHGGGAPEGRRKGGRPSAGGPRRSPRSRPSRLSPPSGNRRTSPARPDAEDAARPERPRSNAVLASVTESTADVLAGAYARPTARPLAQVGMRLRRSTRPSSRSPPPRPPGRTSGAEGPGSSPPQVLASGYLGSGRSSPCTRYGEPVTCGPVGRAASSSPARPAPVTGRNPAPSRRRRAAVSPEAARARIPAASSSTSSTRTAAVTLRWPQRP